MNTSLLKTGLVVAAVGIGAGGLLWQQHENSQLREEITTLDAQLKAAQVASASRATPSKADFDAAHDFAHLSAEVASLPDNSAASWQERAEVLKELMNQFPEMQIPELALATPEDWLDATKQPLKTDADYRQALAQVRAAVMVRFTGEIRTALQAYLKQSNGAFPTDPAQLEPYFAPPVNPEMLHHYKVSPASRFPNMVMGGDAVITVKSPADPNYDTQIVIGPEGMGTTLVRDLVIQPVIAAYRAANPGKRPTSSADLLPYTKTNAQRSAIQAELGSK